MRDAMTVGTVHGKAKRLIKPYLTVHGHILRLYMLVPRPDHPLSAVPSALPPGPHTPSRPPHPESPSRAGQPRAARLLSPHRRSGAADQAPHLRQHEQARLLPGGRGDHMGDHRLLSGHLPISPYISPISPYISATTAFSQAMLERGLGSVTAPEVPPTHTLPLPVPVPLPRPTPTPAPAPTAGRLPAGGNYSAVKPGSDVKFSQYGRARLRQLGCP